MHFQYVMLMSAHMNMFTNSVRAKSGPRGTIAILLRAPLPALSILTPLCARITRPLALLHSVDLVRGRAGFLPLVRTRHEIFPCV